MWKIHRYYLRELAVTSVLTFLVLFGIVLVASLSRGLKMAAGADLLAVLLVTFYWAADTFPHLITLSMLVSTVLTFARASQDREITAIRAAGISPRVPMVAAMIVGLGCSIVGSLALHYVIPRAHYNKYRVVGEAFRSLIMSSKMSSGKIAYGGFFLTAKSKDERGHLHDVVIKLDKGSDASGRRPVYFAREAWLDLAGDGEKLQLQLKGMRDAAGIQNQGHLLLEVDLRGISQGQLRAERDDDMTTDQLLAQVYRGLHEFPAWALFHVHRRACYALMPCLLAPIGFCIGVLARDRGRMTALLLAMGPTILFYACMLGGEQLMRELGQPLIAWLPALVLALTGLPFCWRVLKL